MKSLIALSIRRPVFAWILMSALIIFGGISFGRLGISQMPDIDFPVLSISVEYEGAAPEVVETELIDPMEQNLLSVEGIQEMRSTLQTGKGTINLTFDISRDINVALQEVQTALSSVRLPQNVDPPIVKKTNPEESPIMFIGISSDKTLRETIEWLDNYLLDQFRFLPGIGEVSITGFSQRNLRIWPDLAKMKKYELTLSDLADTLQSQHLESAAGQYSDGKKEYRVRWMGEAANVEQVGNLRIIRRGGQIIQDGNIKISDVARVEDGLSDIRRQARVNGHDAISISIRKQRGGNEVALAKTVRDRIDELQKIIPKEYHLQINVDFTKATSAVVHTTQEKLIVASIVTIFVCFLFLGSWGAALNILFSIPTSIVGTFLVVYFAGFTLNLFTLLALTLAISIVVDDAIMLLENIVRHHRMGKSATQAAYDGAVEILPAAIAATVAVIAVFIPVIFMSGIIGKFFFQFGVTMSVAVLLSLLEAVTITPMRSAAFLSASPKITPLEKKLDHAFERYNDIYRHLLHKALPYSKWIVLFAFTIFLVSLLLIRKVRQEFVPSQDQDFLMLMAQLKPDASIESSYKKAVEMEEIIKKNPNVESFFLSIGMGPGSTSVNQIMMPLNLVSREKRKQTHQEIMEEIRNSLKPVEGVRFAFRDMSSRGLTSGRMNPVSFNITGPDLKILNQKAEELMSKLESEKLTVDMDSDFKMGVPELLIRPRRDKMASSEIPISTVATALNAGVAGARQSQFTSGGHRYDIRIKLEDHTLRSIDDVAKIEVRNQFGLPTPIGPYVEFEKNDTFLSINRLNRQRTIGIFGNLAPGVGQSRALDRAKEIAKEILPPGYGFSFEGTAAGLSESFQSLAYALVIGILVAYMVLAVQFNSFIIPVSVLMALPFSITGALLILWIGGVSLNLFSFIGIIVLMGIAKKNSILLVEFTNHVRHDKNIPPLDALIEACPVRLRPILMTSVATVAAAIPLVIGNSIGQETRTPMGLTIIGGTIVSTVFSLLVVPSIYLLLSRFEKNKSTGVLKT